MKPKLTVGFLVATMLLIIAAVPLTNVAAPEYGTRADSLVLYFYEDIESAYAALKANEIDIVGYEITAELYADAILDTNIALAGVSDTGFYELDLNNNYTINDYPGVKSPMYEVEMRQAIAWLTDKDYIVDVICGGFAERIDAMIVAPSKSWANKSYWYPYYPYEYDPLAAKAVLDSKFPVGSTPNPYYDAGFPGSVQNLRQYPADHPTMAGQDLDPLKLKIRSDDLRRFYAGRLVYGNMRAHGIPCDVIEADQATHRQSVMIDKNYHLYTGGWTVGFFPLYCYTIYHSSFWIAGVNTPNYVTGMNESDLPNYPKLDALAEQIYYAETYDDAISATKLFTGLWTEICVNVPLFSARSYWAYNVRGENALLGLCNAEGNGFENFWSFLNAFKVDDSTIRYGMKSPPSSLNIIYSDVYYDWQCLERMNQDCFGYAPQGLSTPQPGFVRDWETSEWDGGSRTKVTRWFKDSCYFAEPVTGSQKANVNASHYFFSAWYMYADPTSWAYSTMQDVHHIDIVDTHQVDIYFEALSCWLTYEADYFMLPMDVFLQPPLSYPATETFVEGINLTTPSPLVLGGKPVWINSVTANSTHLNMFTDYNIVRGKLEIFTDLQDDTVVVVDYWYFGDPSGYTAGDLPWETVFEGAGLYYATCFEAEVDGKLVLKRNPHYWMETPPLGEVDFVWKWTSELKPRNGTYKVDIYDMVMATGAYASQGTGVPDKEWLLGADVAPPGGSIDIYDIVTIVGNYDREWGDP